MLQSMPHASATVITVLLKLKQSGTKLTYLSHERSLCNRGKVVVAAQKPLMFRNLHTIVHGERLHINALQAGHGANVCFAKSRQKATLKFGDDWPRLHFLQH